MALYIKRVQTVLTEEQYKNLSQLALEVDKPLSVLIREAIEAVYFVPVDLERRRAALESLLSLDAPVADWEQMEEEIIQGALE
jgi:predicted DNA-binding protein